MTATAVPDDTGVAASDASASESSVSAPDQIALMREGIDALDVQIAQLVADRMQLSRRIQAARIQQGGTRLELGRERVILDGYRRVLGPDGPVLGEVVLRVCRGAR